MIPADASAALANGQRVRKLQFPKHRHECDAGDEELRDFARIRIAFIRIEPRRRHRAIEHESVQYLARVDRERFVESEGDVPVQRRNHCDLPDQFSRIVRTLKDESKFANGAGRDPSPARLFPRAFWIKQDYVAAFSGQTRCEVRACRPCTDDGNLR